jgi:hypothetical protein
MSAPERFAGNPDSNYPMPSKRPRLNLPDEYQTDDQ